MTKFPMKPKITNKPENFKDPQIMNEPQNLKDDQI